MTGIAEAQRAAFLEALPLFAAWHPGQPMPTVEVDGQLTPLDDLCAMLWQDRKCLEPSDERALLKTHDVLLVTYASAARYVFRRLKAQRHEVVS